MSKNAYITVLSTEEYLVGVLGLGKCLKKVNSEYNLVTLVNGNISEKSKQILKDNDIEIIETESFKVPEWIKNKNSKNHANWSYTFDKLMIFELTQYDKLVFLDSDMYIRNNIDELFDRPHMSATVDRCDTILVKDNYQKLTSGLLVIKPQEGIMDKFLEIMEDDSIKNKYDNIGDQDIIQLYAPNWENKKELHLPVKYNMFFLDIEYYINKGIYTLDDISVIHFITANKPWKYKKEELTTKYLDWLEFVSKRDYEKGKLEEIRENIEFGRENKKFIIQEYGEIMYECMTQIKV